MKVRDIMTRDVATCSPESSLNEAARVMWERDCGFVPVTDFGGHRLRGVLTDRDICMAAYTKNVPLTQLNAGTIMSRHPKTCQADDDVSRATDLMQEHQIRRLPVTNESGDVIGVISLNDLAVAASDNKDKSLRQDISATLASVCRHRPIAHYEPIRPVTAARTAAAEY